MSRTAATTVAETTMTASAVNTNTNTTTTSTTTTSTSSAQEQSKTSKASITTQASSLVSPTPISLNSTNSSITSALQQSHRSIITSSQMKCKIYFNRYSFAPKIHSFCLIFFLFEVIIPMNLIFFNFRTLNCRVCNLQSQNEKIVRIPQVFRFKFLKGKKN